MGSISREHENSVIIKKEQLDELNTLEENNTSEYHKRLKELFGIKAVPFTAYDYYLDDKYIGNSYEDYPIDLLNEMEVEIEKMNNTENQNEKIRVLVEERQKEFEAHKKIAKEAMRELNSNMEIIKHNFSPTTVSAIKNICLILGKSFGLETNNV